MASLRENQDPRVVLTNRSAWLSLASASFLFVGLLTLGTAIEKTEDIAVRAASSAPLVVAAGGAMWARGTRARLRALGEPAAASTAPGVAGEAGERPPGSTARDERA